MPASVHAVKGKQPDLSSPMLIDVECTGGTPACIVPEISHRVINLLQVDTTALFIILRGDDLSLFIDRFMGRCRTTTKCSIGSTVTRVSSRRRPATHQATDSCHLNTTTLKYVIESNASVPLKVTNFTALILQWLYNCSWLLVSFVISTILQGLPLCATLHLFHSCV